LVKKFLKYLFFIIVGGILIICGLYWRNDIPLEELKAKYTSDASVFVEVMGMDVHYRDEGNPQDSIPIILLHGTGASLHTWEKSIELLKDSFRVITLDLPAYGLTGPNPKKDYSMEFYVDFMSEFLDKINVGSCIMGGNSLGGSIAWNFTYKYPSKVVKLILIDAAGYPMVSESRPIAFTLAQTPIVKHLLKYVTPPFLAAKSVKNVYADESMVTEVIVDRYFELFLREGNRAAFIDRLAHSFQGNIQEISTIQVPTLILWGDQDRLIPLENAYKFKEDLVNSTLHIFKDLGHVPMEESPERTVSVIRSFIK
jgi:pimeloyl-ACP methyl ester carboxylesterase